VGTRGRYFETIVRAIPRNGVEDQNHGDGTLSAKLQYSSPRILSPLFVCVQAGLCSRHRRWLDFRPKPRPRAFTSETGTAARTTARHPSRRIVQQYAQEAEPPSTGTDITSACSVFMRDFPRSRFAYSRTKMGFRAPSPSRSEPWLRASTGPGPGCRARPNLAACTGTLRSFHRRFPFRRVSAPGL
jgi:hypothetical protein